MAITRLAQGSAMAISKNLIDIATGATSKKNYSYSNVKSTATDVDVYDVGVLLSGLHAGSLTGITRDDSNKLVSV